MYRWCSGSSDGVPVVFQDVTVMFQWYFRGVPVVFQFGWHNGVPVVFRRCYGDILVMFREFRWCSGHNPVRFLVCSGGVSVWLTQWCSSAVAGMLWWYSGDVPAMFRWCSSDDSVCSGGVLLLLTHGDVSGLLRWCYMVCSDAFPATFRGDPGCSSNAPCGNNLHNVKKS